MAPIVFTCFTFFSVRLCMFNQFKTIVAGLACKCESVDLMFFIKGSKHLAITNFWPSEAVCQQNSERSASRILGRVLQYFTKVHCEFTLGQYISISEPSALWALPDSGTAAEQFRGSPLYLQMDTHKTTCTNGPTKSKLMVLNVYHY